MSIYPCLLYTSEQVGQKYNFSVYKGDRIAIVGKNGIGKSTLIKTIAKKQKELGGNIQYGSKVSLGYYDQKQAEFESSKTILNELWDEYPLSLIHIFCFSVVMEQQFMNHL